ncbi:S24 family peptidase [Alteromonas macleodii]|uniref:S24 family peptidase n=1 Tax=Alteromonas macleodii TaxID=28108 RepID=UPI002ECF986A|nr:S24 family peptidase [Pseudomonadota bacterium]
MRVTGSSMLPSLSHGDFVCAMRWPFRWLRSGQIVVVKSSTYGVIIKRVDHVNTDGTFTLTGDNKAHSVSQEAMGKFTRAQLLGKVIYHTSE